MYKNILLSVIFFSLFQSQVCISFAAIKSAPKKGEAMIALYDNSGAEHEPKAADNHKKWRKRRNYLLSGTATLFLALIAIIYRKSAALEHSTKQHEDDPLREQCQEIGAILSSGTHHLVTSAKNPEEQEQWISILRKHVQDFCSHLKELAEQNTSPTAFTDAAT